MERLVARDHEAIAPDLPLHDPQAGFDDRVRPAPQALETAADPVIARGVDRRCYARRRGFMTTAELIAKLKSDDPHGVREVVIWESDEELTTGVERVALRDDRVVVITSRRARLG